MVKEVHSGMRLFRSAFVFSVSEKSMCSYYFVSEGRLSVYLFRKVICILFREKSLRKGIMLWNWGAPPKVGGVACSNVEFRFYLFICTVTSYFICSGE